MTTQRTLHGPGELLAAIPSLMGFVPTESLVVLAVREGAELGVVLRVDRSDVLAPDAGRPLARALADHLARDGARMAVLVSFTADDVRLACPAIDAVRPAIAELILDVEAWAVTGGRYFSPGCARDACCPVAGHLVPQPPPAISVPARLGGGRHGAIGSAPDARFRVNEAARRKAQRAGERWWAGRGVDLEAWRRESFANWNTAFASASEGRAVRETTTGRVIVALQDRRVRDAILVSMLPGSGDVASRILDGSGDAEVPKALRVLLDCDEGRPPAHPELAITWDVLGSLIAHARTSQRAPMFTLCAVLAWWEGQGDACRALLVRAHASEPGYRLAGLIECTLLAGIQPGWKKAA